MAYNNSINFSKLQEELNKPKTYNDGPKVPGRKVFPFWEYAKLGKESSQFVFLAGEFKSRLSAKNLPWFEGFEHRTAIVNDKGMKEYPFVACSAGNDKNDKQPCVGCHLFESNKPAPYTKKENRAPNPWGQKLFTVFCVAHLAWYKRVIRLNKDGVPVVFADVPQYNEILCATTSFYSFNKMFNVF
jgi:hypothetical protein